MTNKKLPDLAPEKTTDKAKNTTDKHKPEMGSARAVNQQGNSNSHPEANDERRELTRKSDPAVPNPGRDITTGSDGFDGQGRVPDGDQNNSVTNADHDSTDAAVQSDQRKLGRKEKKA